ncbi:hypothetical protein H0H93_008032 [Arthromyces matolae]|nr:hypothetical protein H0H93_008032 [Arthromyces matolae]
MKQCEEVPAALEGRVIAKVKGKRRSQQDEVVPLPNKRSRIMTSSPPTSLEYVPAQFLPSPVSTLTPQVHPLLIPEVFAKRKDFYMNSTRRQDYLKGVLSKFKGVCIVCTMLDGDERMHEDLGDCTRVPVFGGASFYELSFRTGLRTSPGGLKVQACYTCWCPKQFEPLDHENFVGRECPNEFHKRFWRVFGFVIWYCLPLRQAVFDYLGVDLPTTVADDDYKRWLCSAGSKWSGFPNIGHVVFAYMRLKELGKLESIGSLEMDPAVYRRVPIETCFQ